MQSRLHFSTFRLCTGKPCGPSESNQYLALSVPTDYHFLSFSTSSDHAFHLLQSAVHFLRTLHTSEHLVSSFALSLKQSQQFRSLTLTNPTPFPLRVLSPSSPFGCKINKIIQ